MFKERLRELRTSRHLSQSELAARIGMSKSAISMYEVGSREPSYETLELFADYFKVDMNYLLGRSDYTTFIMNGVQFDIVSSIGDISNEQAKRLVHFINTLDSLNDEGQEKLLEYADMLQKSGYIKSDPLGMVEEA